LGKPAAAYVLSSNTPSDVVYGDGAVAYEVEDRLEFLDLRSTGRRASMPLKELLNPICSGGTLQRCELLWLREEIVVLKAYVDHVSTSLDKPFLLAIDFSDPVCPRFCMVGASHPRESFCLSQFSFVVWISALIVSFRTP